MAKLKTQLKTVSFPVWPCWNPQFSEKDVMLIHAVRYRPAAKPSKLAELPATDYRLSIGRNGVSVFFLTKKGELPELAKAADAVQVEYEP